MSFHPSIAKAKVQPVFQPVGPLPSEHLSNVGGTFVRLAAFRTDDSICERVVC